MSAIGAIQTAFYGVLSADATIPTLSLTIDPRTGTFTTVSVHNDIPDGATYPHVLISRATERPWHTFGGPTVGIGWKDMIRVHIYSRYQGDEESTNILERVVALLNFQTLTVSGYSASAMVEYRQGRMLVEAIDKLETRHLVGEFEVVVH
jgi:hypothetical protein